MTAQGTARGGATTAEDTARRPAGPHLRPVRADDAAAILDAFRTAPDLARQGDVHDAESAVEYCTWLRGRDRLAFAIVPGTGVAHPGASAKLDDAANIDDLGTLESSGNSEDPSDPADRMIGLVAVSVDEGNLNGWFFYWLHPSHRGQGLAARAAASLAERALRAAAGGGWGLERLELGHRVDNPASGAVARAAGFLLEGTEREKFLIGGERVDVLTYGRLATDPEPPTALLPWSPES